MDQNRASFTDTSNDGDEEVVVAGTDTDTSDETAVSASQVNQDQEFKRIEGLAGVGGNEDLEPSPTPSPIEDES